MDIEYLQGNWEGTYTYRPKYPEEYQTLMVHFNLRLTVKDEIVSGECEDPYTTQYFGQPAKIEGVFINNEFSFIKKYPCYMAIDENDNILIDRSREALDIHYVGTVRKRLFSRTYLIEGSWDISGSFIDNLGQAQYYSVEGEWVMRRTQ